MLLTALFKKLCPDGQALRKTARMMKIVTLFLLAGCLQLSARTAAQTISLTLTNATLSTAFAEIQRQSDYRFVYTNEQLIGASRVSIKVENATLEKVLELCFREQPLTYRVEDKFIILKLKEEKPHLLSAIENDVKGKVLNDKDEPVVAATVVVKGSKQATSTDSKGEFLLYGIVPGSTITISSIGYETLEVVIGNNRNLVVHLVTAVNALDETIIKGYYATSKRLNTGNVGKIRGAAIQQQSAINPLQAVEGRIPGVFVSQATGLPGSSFTVQIRGLNSIASGNAPLYIIDGVPYLSTSLASSYTSFAILGGNPLSAINPADIESIEILKDADATAIYGSRGANGVVLITTKKGKSGSTRLDISFQAGAGRPARKMKLLNTPEYLAVRHEAFANDGKLPTVANAPDLLLWDTSRNTDWQKQGYGETAHSTDVQASVSGGNSNTQYLFGAGYRRESTVFNGDFSDRKGSVHINITSQSTNQKFKLGFAGTYIYDNNRLPFTDITKNILLLPPTAPAPFTADGGLNWENGFKNPFAALRNTYRTTTENLVSNLQLSYTLLPGLDIKTSFGYNSVNLRETGTVPKSSYNPALNVASGFGDFANGSVKSWIVEPQMQYQRLIHAKGMLTLQLGGSFQETVRQSLTQEGRSFSTDALLDNIAGAGTVTILSNTYSQYRYNAVFGRVNYNLKDEYLLNVTARRDGSSRFGPGKQFANFGAAGIAWIFTKQQLFSNHLRFMSYGKIRASYGVSGNDQIADYGYLSLWTPTSYPYQATAGLTPNRLANPDYGWETNKKSELGIDIGFFHDRILIGLAWYLNKATNQLVGYPLPVFTGQSSVQANLPAVVQNKGFELDFNSTILKSTNFTWSMGINLTAPRNKLVSYPNLSSSTYKSQYIVGKSLFVKRLLHYTGVNASTGMYDFQDMNNNGSGIDIPADYQFLQEVTQKYYGGIQQSFRYKQWTLDVLLQFVKQNGYNYTYGGFDVPGTFGNQPAYVLDRWQKPRDQNAVQKYTQTSGAAYFQYVYGVFYGDLPIADASYLRLRNVYLAYRFPENLLKKAGIKEGSIFMSAQNMFTITDYQGIDPENQSITAVPPLRFLNAGIKLSF